MKQSVWFGMCAAVVCTVTIAVAAQTTPPSSQTPSSSAADKVTVTGCIERSSAAPSATPGSTGTSGSTSASNDTKFVLNTSPAGYGAAGTSGTAGTSTPPTSAGASAKSYRLDADDSQLTPHVGHKVEITGTVQSAGSTSTSSSSSSSSASSTATATAPKLKVDSVKMIASSCS